jgi:hypothetical protein
MRLDKQRRHENLYEKIITFYYTLYRINAYKEHDPFIYLESYYLIPT